MRCYKHLSYEEIARHTSSSSRPGVKIRLVELARAMAAYYEVYVLDWRAVQGRYTFAKRISVTVNDVFKFSSSRISGNISFVEFSTLHRPIAAARMWNRYFLKRFINKNNIDIVINGSYYLFSVSKNRSFNPDSEIGLRTGFKYIIDLADLPPQEPEYKYVDDFTRQEALKSEAVTTASLSLAGYVANKYGKQASFIPNGISLSKIRKIGQDEIISLRKYLGIVERHIVGYVGYIGDWVDVELAVNAFHIFQKNVPKAVLLWIGNAPDLGSMKNRYASRDILFIGPVEKNIELYFRAIDTGLIPMIKSPFQDMAFHLKLIGYTAAQKPVVSAKLNECMSLRFPNVLFAENDANEWAKMLEIAKSMTWKDEWDAMADSFDWEKISGKLYSLIEKAV